MNAQAVLLSLLLGFALSILFFIDQNVSAALVSNLSNKLKKGDAYHWDLLVVGLLNAFLSLLGLPWMHGILPHSPMHARALADVVPLTDAHNSGAAKSFAVLRVRETRVTGILIHVLIGLVVTLWPTLFSFIPVAVLSGLFLFCAVNTLRDNSLYERVLLMITEQVRSILLFCIKGLFNSRKILSNGLIGVDFVKKYFLGDPMNDGICPKLKKITVVDMPPSN